MGSYSLHRMAALAALALSLCACASTSTVKQSGQLADAGIAYGAAAENVIVLTRDRYLDWHSEAILAELSADDEMCTPEEIVDEQGRSAACAALVDDFDASTSKDQAFIEELSGLARQAGALGRYFQALKSLATYDANGEMATATAGLLTNIDALSDKLEAKAGISDQQKATWGKLAGLVGDSVKASHLRNRLREDAAIIGRAIDIQEGVLDANAATLAAIEAAQRTEAFERNVRISYLTGAALSNAASWRTQRRLALLPGPAIEQLRVLRSASDSLRNVWEDILSGRGSPESARQLFDDIAKASKLLGEARKAQDGND
jgi:hypothetical protein